MAAVVKAKGASTSLRRNNKMAYALLFPGLLWLAIFFVAPILTLVSIVLMPLLYLTMRIFGPKLGVYNEKLTITAF